MGFCAKKIRGGGSSLRIFLKLILILDPQLPAVWKLAGDTDRLDFEICRATEYLGATVSRIFAGAARSFEFCWARHNFLCSPFFGLQVRRGRCPTLVVNKFCPQVYVSFRFRDTSCDRVVLPSFSFISSESSVLGWGGASKY